MWKDVFNKVIATNNFNGIPVFASNLVRDYNCYDWIRLGDFPYPVLDDLMINRVSPYDIEIGINWLVQNNIHGLVVTESSTALKELLITLLNMKGYNTSINTTIGLAVQCKFETKTIKGLVVKFKRKG